MYILDRRYGLPALSRHTVHPWTSPLRASCPLAAYRPSLDIAATGFLPSRGIPSIPGHKKRRA
ncbi:MAG: hypothetical protein WBN48_03560, partial [Thiogranum sp.]